MARVGRPPVGQRISVRLPGPLLAELDERARSAGVTRAEALRTLLTATLSPEPDGVDRAQIARRLRMTPAERVRTMAEETRRVLALVGRTG